MKISCNACGASYGIADEKVAGRLVKVRCKNCGAAIVVDGREAHSPGPKPASTPPAAASAATVSNEWSVNLTETDSRTMSTAEIVQMYPTGQLDDAYVWKEGMDDWVPLLDVPELAKAVAKAKSLPPPAAAAPAFAAGGGAALAAKPKAGPAPDLFGSVATAGSEAEAATAADVSMAPDAKPLGARNENSVLFSLDALKAGVTGPARPPERRPPMNPLGSSGGDGMSAIMNLSADPMFSAASNEALLMAPAPPPEPPKPKPKPKIEEPVVASMAAPPPKRSNVALVAVASVVGTLVIVGIVLALVLGGKKDDATAKQEDLSAKQGEDTAKTNATGEDDKKPKDDAAKDNAAKDDAAKDDAAKDDAAKDDAAKDDAAKDDAAKDDAAKDDAAKDDGKPATKEELEAFKKAAAEKAKEEAAKKDEPKKDEPKKDEPKNDLGSFNKQAAIASLGAAAAQAAACKKPDGPTGTGRATVTFAPSGRVTSANVSGSGFGGTAVGGCVASIFRRANVPPFTGGSVTVSKSFTIP